MARTITVKGTGNIAVKPDYITISMTIETLEKTYAKALESAAQKINALYDAVIRAGLKKEDLKTTRFDVDTSYEQVKKWDGNYERQFQGYTCTYDLKLSFDFNNTQLSKTLESLADSEVSPDLNIYFTVKDPATVSEALLRAATKNAKAKAEILCQASGCQLGTLQHIDYNWCELNLLSDTVYERPEAMPVGGGYVPDMTPDDIHTSDTVTFIWEIL